MNPTLDFMTFLVGTRGMRHAESRYYIATKLPSTVNDYDKCVCDMSKIVKFLMIKSIDNY